MSGRISESLFASLKAAGTSSRVVARVFKVSVHFTYSFLCGFLFKARLTLPV